MARVLCSARFFRLHNSRDGIGPTDCRKLIPAFMMVIWVLVFSCNMAQAQNSTLRVRDFVDGIGMNVKFKDVGSKYELVPC